MEKMDSVLAIKTMDAITEIILIDFHRIFHLMILTFNKVNLIAKYSSSYQLPTILKTKIIGMRSIRNMKI